MGTADLGPWKPTPLAEAVKLFINANFRWWVSGGNALDLHLGRSWRRHDDTDIGIIRTDVTKLFGVLGDWDIHVAAAGVLRPWDGETLAADRSQNNLWCRPTPEDPWALDITIGEGTHEYWSYRRDPTIHVRWPDAVLHTAGGIPYLAPELQLLFKSQTIRPKDILDATAVIPALDATRRARLANLLAPDHPWQSIIASSNPAH